MKLDTDTLLWLAVVTSFELLIIGAYFLFTSAEATTFRHLLYPIIWINIGVLAVIKTKPTKVETKYKILGVAISAIYFLVLMNVAGLIRIGGMNRGLNVAWMVTPGWGPVLSYSGSFITFSLIPFQTIGYVALSYLVYATLVDATKAVVSGLIGLVSCVGCTWPIAASLLAGLFGGGGSSALSNVVYSYSYGLSTLVFLVAVALLYWRPYSPSKRE
ncbi:MAG: hypothetical protein SV377_02080 [Halobacteria archaeon]|nr:hypothetical protein [Halobacteria archaeon]